MGGEAFYLAPSPLVSPLVSQTEHIFLRTHSMQNTFALSTGISHGIPCIYICTYTFYLAPSPVSPLRDAAREREREREKERESEREGPHSTQSTCYIYIYIQEQEEDFSSSSAHSAFSAHELEAHAARGRVHEPKHAHMQGRDGAVTSEEQEKFTGAARGRDLGPGLASFSPGQGSLNASSAREHILQRTHSTCINTSSSSSTLHRLLVKSALLLQGV